MTFACSDFSIFEAALDKIKSIELFGPLNEFLKFSFINFISSIALEGT